MANTFSAITAIAASLLVLVAFAGIPSFAVVATEAASGNVQKRQKQPEAYQERLVDWILEDPDGFFHPAILWERQLGPDGSTKSGPYAMHATEDIPEGTPLVVLPRKYVLESDLRYWVPVDDHHRMCITISKMLEEYNKHNYDRTEFRSFYAPYLSYLFEEIDITTGLLPTSWSDHSQRILDLILEVNEDKEQKTDDDDDYEDEDVDDDEYKGDEEEYSLMYDSYHYHSLSTICDLELHEAAVKNNYPQNDVVLRQAEDAYRFLMSRGWHDKLVPVIDMFNHQNGPGRNVELTAINNKKIGDVAAYAWKDISKGEQLQYSHSECMDRSCDRGMSRYRFSTQRIFAEYGFVERYPHRWLFDQDQLILAEVTTDTNDETKKVFKWIFESPNEETILWIRVQLQRLKSIESTVREGVRELESVLIPEGFETTFHNIDHERDTILELYEGFVEVFELALEHKDDPVAVTRDSFDDEIDELQETYGQYLIEELREHELLRSSVSTPLHEGDASEQLLQERELLHNGNEL